MSRFARRLVATVLLSCVCAAAVASGHSSFEEEVVAAKAAMLEDPHKVFARAREAAAIAQAGPAALRPARLATVQWLEAESSLRLNDPKRAGPLIDAALARLRDGAPTKLKGDLLMTRGGYDSATGAVGQALADNQAAYNIFRHLNDSRSRALALINISVLYFEASNAETALRYLAEAREVSTADVSLSYSIRGTTAQILKDKGRYQEAAEQTRAAVALAHTLHSPVLTMHMLRNLVRIELLLMEQQQADRDLAEAFRTARDLPRDDDYAFLLNTAGQAALQRGQVADAVALVDRSFTGINPKTTTLSFRSRHETAYDVYTRAGQPAKALIHLAAMKRLDDEAAKLATSASAALMGARFDFANQEARIADLRADEAQRSLAFAQARARLQRNIFLGAGAATLVVIALLGFGLVTIRRSRNQTRAANISLGETNSALGKALAAKTEFLATTSHEIRTPLNGILGMTQVMLADPALDPGTRDRVSIVHGAGETMRALVDDILDIAKIESGKLVVEAAPMNVCGVLTDVSRLWKEQAAARGLVLAVDLADCPAQVMGDAARLRQIVFNLLSNALKFTAEGTVALHAAASDDRTRYHVTISDTGIGIPADKLDEIFESFRQGDTSTTRRFGGTGLGLAICRSLARAMGGEVRVTSETGRGSRFTLDLPLVAVAEAPAEVLPVLLIVERNPIARSVLKAVLEPHVPAVAVAGSLDEALARIAQGGVERVLADDGTLRAGGELEDTAARLAAAGAPVALLLSASNGAAEPRLLAAGIEQVIAKPIAGPALTTAMFGNMHHPCVAPVPRAA